LDSGDEISDIARVVKAEDTEGEEENNEGNETE